MTANAIARSVIATVVATSMSRKFRTLTCSRNEAELVLNATSKGLADEQYANLSNEEQAEISAATAHLSETMKGADHAAIRDAIERLSQATQHLAELIMNSAIEKALKDKRVREIQ